jgi:hypothetical protein
MTPSPNYSVKGAIGTMVRSATKPEHMMLFQQETTMFKHEIENTASDFLTDDQLELAAGGVALNAVDPTNPLCPEPRPLPGQILNPHKG